MRHLLASLSLVVALASGARAAPEWSGNIGGTFGAAAVPNSGGFSLSLAAMWPLDGRFSFGGALFADDMGLAVGPLNDAHTGAVLGEIERLHRAVYAGAWRLDARAATVRGWEPFASGTWGYYRIIDDLHGALVSHVGSTGISLAGGVRRPLGSWGSLGVSLRYHGLFNNRLGRYLNAGLDWAWRGAR